MAVHTQMFDLSGMVALVTGGSGSIGGAIATGLVSHGSSVLIGARNIEKAEQVARQLNQQAAADETDPIAAAVQLDVTCDNSVERAVCKTVDLFVRIDILVNVAGQTMFKPTFELTTDEFQHLYDTHVTGTLRCAQVAGHLFREQHRGCIINLASISSFVDLVEITAYAAAKNAVLGLTRSLANEWAKYGIRTNAIAPGFIPTSMNRTLIEQTDRGRRIIEHTPMGRFGSADEIAPAAVFLASPASSFVNGHTLVVDGGYLACGIGGTTAPWENDVAEAADPSPVASIT